MIIRPKENQYSTKVYHMTLTLLFVGFPSKSHDYSNTNLQNTSNENCFYLNRLMSVLPLESPSKETCL